MDAGVSEPDDLNVITLPSSYSSRMTTIILSRYRSMIGQILMISQVYHLDEWKQRLEFFISCMNIKLTKFLIHSKFGGQLIMWLKQHSRSYKRRMAYL